jgi:outer membrane protein assembly factor BamB/nucleoside phosphorylase
MSGICAEDKRQVRLGDLVIAEYAYHYEEGKVKCDQQGTPQQYPGWMTYGLANQVLAFVNTFETWRSPIVELKRPDLMNDTPPQAFIAPMASGMAVRSDDPFEVLQQHNRKTLALDMEAAAFYQTLHDFPQIVSLVVKGVSDYADQSKNDQYHAYAAHASAIYLLSFIQEYVTEETIPRRNLSVSSGGTKSSSHRKSFFPHHRRLRHKTHEHTFFDRRGVLLVLLALLGLGTGSYALLNNRQTPAPVQQTYDQGVTANGMMFGFNPQHTRYNPYESTINVNNVVQLSQAWVTPTQGTIRFSLSVANGMVYGSSDRGMVYAFDVNTGDQKWSSASAGAEIESSPAVANRLVYVGSDDHSVYAFDARSGQVKWQFKTGGEVKSSPVVVDGMLYIGSNDHFLYALNASSGQKLWATPTNETIDSSPAVANGLVYVGSNDHSVYAFDARSGTQKWSYLAGDIFYSSPAIVNGVLYIGCSDHKLYALNTNDGTLKWAFSTGGEITSSPAVANGIVYIGAHDSNLYAIDAVSGTPKWVHSKSFNVLESFLVIKRKFVLISYNGYSYLTSI